MNKKNISNLELSRRLKENYSEWKDVSLRFENYFIIFNKFSNDKLLNISGNALKLYIYLGINSNTKTGEVWHSNKTIAEYFNKSERTIRSWMTELERMNLVYRLQLKFNEESHTYLQPYFFQNYIKSEKYVYAFRFKNTFNRTNIPLILFEDKIIRNIKKYFKIKSYIKIYDDYFRIQTYTPINKNLLIEFPSFLTKNLLESLLSYSKIINENSSNTITIDKSFIFENFKYKDRYYSSEIE